VWPGAPPAASVPSRATQTRPAPNDRRCSRTSRRAPAGATRAGEAHPPERAQLFKDALKQFEDATPGVRLRYSIRGAGVPRSPRWTTVCRGLREVGPSMRGRWRYRDPYRDGGTPGTGRAAARGRPRRSRRRPPETRAGGWVRGEAGPPGGQGDAPGPREG